MNVVRDFAAVILPFLFVLGLVVTVHELGHFLMAKAFGTRIDRFSIGFGRALLKWRDRSGVEWRVGWIPLGGYVRFAGDADASSLPDTGALADMKAAIVAREGAGAERRYFHFKPLWQRGLVVLAGPLANFALAIAIFTALLCTRGEWLTRPQVAQVVAASPAAVAGFQPGDRILSMNGRAVSDFSDVGRFVLLHTGDPIAFSVQRGGAVVDLVATPRRQALGGRLAGGARMGRLGIGAVPSTHVVYDLPTGVVRATQQTWEILEGTLTYLGRIFTGREPADQISGAIGIGNAAYTVADVGGQGAPSALEALGGALLALTGLAAVISIGLGFLNLLPVPVLDGGHLAFYAYEAVARRPLPARAQELAFRVGLAMLLGLMLFAAWNDLQRLRVFQVFGGLFS